MLRRKQNGRMPDATLGNTNIGKQQSKACANTTQAFGFYRRIISKAAEEISKYFLRCVIRQTRLFQMLFYIDLEQFAVSVNLDAVGLGGYHDQIER